MSHSSMIGDAKLINHWVMMGGMGAFRSSHFNMCYGLNVCVSPSSCGETVTPPEWLCLKVGPLRK